MRRLSPLSVILSFACFALLTSSGLGQTPPVDSAGHQWWQNAVFYEIYPRSFADSNNDGIGDLNGIASKLGYLKTLGVDAIWITPCYPSPQVDFGYDVSDYEAIDPMYGTLKDFDTMQKSAHQHGIRIIMDYVINHTSDQHPWFVDSRSSKTSAHRDWYVWRDANNGGVPNNWVSVFGGSAWQFDPATSQYYYHAFYRQQPDLNWNNPAVKKAMFDVTRWWYDRGVAGFRLDAVGQLFEDPKFRDNPVLPGKNEHGDPKLDEIYTADLPEVHDVLQELRRVADAHNAVLVGETWTSNIEELKKYYGNNNEIQMPMNFMFTMVNKLSAPTFRQRISQVEASGGWPVYVISNHDIQRSYNRYGDGQHNDAIAKLMAGLYLTLRGTPIMYYGEEIGMENNDPNRVEDVKDPVGRVNWPVDKGRDGERTPMQWNGGANAGFTKGSPWLPVPASAASNNVETENKDPKSVLQFYRHLLALRHRNQALLDGEYVSLNQDDPNVLSYLRRYKDHTVLIALNFSAAPQKMSFDLAGQGLAGAKAKTLLTTADSPHPALSDLSLDPFEVYIAEISK